MTDKIIKAVIFDKKARVTLITSTEAVKEEIKLHDLSPLAAAVLGRALTAGAYISTNLKGKNDTFSMSIKGGGLAGNVVIAGSSGNIIRGFVENPYVNLPLKANGKLDVGGAVGTKGFITVIKDFGLKEPYMGKCELFSGEIAEDFAYYLLKSEGIKSAVSLGVRMNAEGAVASGGIIVEVLPDADENMIFMLEDIMTNFSEISAMLCEKTPEEILDFYFGHLDCEILSTEELILKCNCSRERINDMIIGLGKDETMNIVSEVGMLEVGCQFCSKKYTYDKQEVEKLWETL